jgi:transcriptional regulator with PAS, ATPase and Fis domain
MGRKPPQSAAVNDLIVSQVAGRVSLRSFVRSTRDAYVAEALRQCNGNMCKAAKLLNVHRNTMAHMIEELACFEE